MEFSFYYTEVTWCWWEESKRKTAQEAVVVCATSYSHAAGIVEENYGDELVSIDKIEQISEDKVLPLSILSGRALRDAAINYGAAEIIEESVGNSNTRCIYWDEFPDYMMTAFLGDLYGFETFTERVMSELEGGDIVDILPSPLF